MKVIIEKTKQTVEILAEEIYEKEVKPFGNGSAHVGLPVRWIGKHVWIVFGGKIKKGIES